MDTEKTKVGAGESQPPTAGSSPKYVIATVGDFLKVPEDRQAECLAECRALAPEAFPRTANARSDRPEGSKETP